MKWWAQLIPVQKQPAVGWGASVPAANSETTEGTYKICVKVSDSMNTPAVMASSNFTIDKTGPSIDAGSAVAANTVVTLSPNLGDAVSQTWSGPAQVSFGNSNLAASTVSANTDGDYAIILTAVDAAGNSSTDSLVFTWDTTGPTVDVGGDITIGSTISRTATVSGDAASYLWSQESGPGTINFSDEDDITTDISANVDGTYVVRLTVADSLGNTSWDELNFTRDTTGVSVNVGSDLTVKLATEAAVTPTVSGEGTANYLWSRVSGTGTIDFQPNATTRNLTGISSDTEGSFVLRLTVTNTDNSNTGSDDLIFVWDSHSTIHK